MGEVQWDSEERSKQMNDIKRSEKTRLSTFKSLKI